MAEHDDGVWYGIYNPHRAMLHGTCVYTSLEIPGMCVEVSAVYRTKKQVNEQRREGDKYRGIVGEWRRDVLPPLFLRFLQPPSACVWYGMYSERQKNESGRVFSYESAERQGEKVEATYIYRLTDTYEMTIREYYDDRQELGRVVV
jgi:hypothetical protein